MKRTPLRNKRPTPRTWKCSVCGVNQSGIKTCLECKARKGVKRTNLKAKCDRLARELCRRLADGKCARCGGEGSDWAHRFPRRFHNLRWDMRNCDFLCRPCHQFFTDHPSSFHIWLTIQLKSVDAVEALEREANSQWDRDYLLVINYLENYVV